MKYLILSILFMAAIALIFQLVKEGPEIHSDNNNSAIQGEFISYFPNENDTVFISNAIKSVVSNKFIYVLDQRRNSILQFDINGNFLGSTGHHGRGPGELIMPLSISADDSSLYTFEQDKMQVQQFDHDRSYKDVVMFNGAFEDITVSGPNYWLVNFYFPGMPEFPDMRGIQNSSIFTIYDKSLDTLYAAGEFPEIYSSLNLEKGRVLVDVHKENIFVTFPTIPQVNIFNGETRELIHSFSLESDLLDRHMARLVNGKKTDFSFRNLSVNDKGLFLPIFGEEMQILHFNFDGELISTLYLPDYFQPDSNDKYIRHIETLLMEDSGKMRLFANIFNPAFPRSVIIDLEL